MTSAELKQMVNDMGLAEDLTRRDLMFAHVLIGIVVALENIREEMILISHPMLVIGPDEETYV